MVNRKRMSSSLFKFADRYSVWPRHIRKIILNRSYHRRADEYLHAVIIPLLDLKAIRLIADHNKRKLYRAESPEGPVAVKLYLDYGEFRVGKQQKVYPLFQANGFDAAPLVHAEAGAESLERYGISFLVTRWIEGERLTRESPELVAESIRCLARLHSIELDSSMREAMSKSTSSAPTDSINCYVLERTSRALNRVKRAGIKLSRDSEHRIRETIREGLIRVERARIPTVLVHLDFGPHNLIRDADGHIHVFDFDNLRAGCFGFDLATALILFAYGRRTPKLTRDDLEAIIEGRSFGTLLETYFESAPKWTRDAWGQFHEIFMLWAYLNGAGMLARQSRKATRNDRKTRARYGRGVEMRLRKIEAYLRSARDPLPID